MENKIIGNGFNMNYIIAMELEKELNQEEEIFYEYTNLKGKNLEMYKKELEHLKKISSETSDDPHRRGEISAEKGASLETLVRILIDGTGVLNRFCNVGTATNEIDFIVAKNYKGERLQEKISEKLESDKAFEKLIKFEKYFLAECKNHNKKVSSTWIGKFYTLNKTCGKSSKIGVFFSYYGISGTKKGWTDGHGLIKILNSTCEFSIIEFNIEDYEAIANGENFFRLFNKKILELDVGAGLSDYNIPHDNSEEFKEKISKCQSLN
ncbi:hypothetical protein ACV3QH_02115 [Clostridium perfringens]